MHMYKQKDAKYQLPTVKWIIDADNVLVVTCPVYYLLHYIYCDITYIFIATDYYFITM